jgi:hypothetical protein
MIGILGDAIVVRDAIKIQEWSVKVALNQEGRCTLRLGEEKTILEQWQFRKKALEGLFLGD